MTTSSPDHQLAHQSRLSADFLRFVAIGLLTSVTSSLSFLVLRTVFPAIAANLSVTVVVTVLGTELNGRLNFSGHAPPHPGRARAQDAIFALFSVCAGSVLLMIMQSFGADTTPLAETAALTVLGGCAGVLRFAVLRYWVFVGKDATPRESRPDRTFR